MGHVEPAHAPAPPGIAMYRGSSSPSSIPPGGALEPKTLDAWEAIQPEEDLDFGDESPNPPVIHGGKEAGSLQSPMAATAAATAVSATLGPNREKPTSGGAGPGLRQNVGNGSLPMLPRTPLGKGPVSYLERVLPHRLSHNPSDALMAASNSGPLQEPNAGGNATNNSNSNSNSNNDNCQTPSSGGAGADLQGHGAIPPDSVPSSVPPKALSSAGPGTGGATSLRSFGSAAAGNITVGNMKEARRSRTMEALTTRGPATATAPARLAPLRVPTCCGSRLTEACCCRATKQLSDQQHDPWEERRMVTGATARLVRYSAGDLPWRDISFSGGAGDRIQVTWMQTHGRAHVAGVKLGDTLASIDGHRIDREEHADTVYQRLSAPCVLIFLGFVGKMNAEVRLTTRLPKCGMSLHEEIIHDASPVTAALEGTQPEPPALASGMDYDDNPNGNGPTPGRIEEEVDFYRSNDSLFLLLQDDESGNFSRRQQADSAEAPRQETNRQGDVSKLPDHHGDISQRAHTHPSADSLAITSSLAAAAAAAAATATATGTAAATAAPAASLAAAPGLGAYSPTPTSAVASSPSSTTPFVRTAAWTDGPLPRTVATATAAATTTAEATATTTAAANAHTAAPPQTQGGQSGGLDGSAFWSAVAACADDFQEYAGTALLAAAPAPSATLLPTGPIVLEVKAREARALLGSILKQKQGQGQSRSQSRTGESRSPSSLGGIRSDSGATEDLQLVKSVRIDF